MLAVAVPIIGASAMGLVDLAIVENDRDLVELAAFHFGGDAVATPDHVRNGALAKVFLPARERLRVCEGADGLLGDALLGHWPPAHDRVSRRSGKDLDSVTGRGYGS